MREIILDTETTGLEPSQGHRIVEIGAVELFNHIPTGRIFHAYLNPERDMPREAEAVHGLTGPFLRDKPLFSSVANELVEFLADSRIVIHNASFDMAFLNSEFANIGKAPIQPGRVTDTLQLARQRHPMGPNSLDALCKRYGVDSSKRSKHGALLDSELLAEVYLELLGGRQTMLSLPTATIVRRDVIGNSVTLTREKPLAPRLTEAELAAHASLVGEIESALWSAIEV